MKKPHSTHLECFTVCASDTTSSESCHLPFDALQCSTVESCSHLWGIHYANGVIDALKQAVRVLQVNCTAEQHTHRGGG